MGVDIISCGAEKRDPRIGNPGPYRAYLGYAFPGRWMRGYVTPSPHFGGMAGMNENDRCAKKLLTLLAGFFLFDQTGNHYAR